VLIGVHIPKTAGTSVRHVLEVHFQHQLHVIYGEKPMAGEPKIRQQKLRELALVEESNLYPGIGCIYGHLLPFRYHLFRNNRQTRFFTWVRHPIERMVSQYYHIQRQPFHTFERPLFKRIILEKWTLEQFLFCPEMKNLQSNYLWSFPIEYFSFIGITEYFIQEFTVFCNMFLGKIYDTPVLNTGGYAAPENQVAGELRMEAKKFHAEDMVLYTRALEMREKRS
jgi:hypothetical protein